MRILKSGIIAVLTVATATNVAAGAARDAILAALQTQAKAADPAFATFDPARGEALFRAQSTTGKPDTPSCTTCHTQNPKHPGRTRAGKEIAAMALSVTPDRYGDAEKVEKWFARNCQSVLGRPCTAQEKGDFISFMIAQ